MYNEITDSGTTSQMGSTASHENRDRRQPGPGPVRYGLPCSNCKIYYAAELAACPICGCGDRISPQVAGFADSASML